MGRKPTTSQFSSTVVFLGLVSLILSYTAVWLADPEHHPKPAATKRRFTNFDDFYPFYLSEHSEPTNRYLHFVGTSLFFLSLLREPRLLLVGPVALAVGLNVFYLTLDVPHGFFEFGSMIAAFILAGKLATGKWTPPVATLASGYFWAWLGHFFVEKNKPATFTFATFSFLGDMKMYSQVLGDLKAMVVK